MVRVNFSVDREYRLTLLVQATGIVLLNSRFGHDIAHGNVMPSISNGATVRWRRGDPVAHVFADRHAGDSDDSLAAIDTITVPRTGWTDIADVRQVATRWLRAKGT